MTTPPVSPPRSTNRTLLIVVLVVLGLLAGSVPCCGIVSAIAIPAFVNYTRRAKTAEAQANLRNMSRAVEAYCQAEHAGGSLWPAPAGPTPEVPTSARQIAMWGPEWQSLGFAPAEPVYYAYSIVPVDASTLIVRAEGDLDDDGTRSRFEARCVSSSPGSCSCGEVVVENELE
jgi:type II secretory pathway pseudopilin PulG